MAIPDISRFIVFHSFSLHKTFDLRCALRVHIFHLESCHDL
jgi:hypothetical protein